MSAETVDVFAVVLTLAMFSWLLKTQLSIMSTSNSSGVRLLTLVQSLPWEAYAHPYNTDQHRAQTRALVETFMVASERPEHRPQALELLRNTEEALYWQGMHLPNDQRVHRRHAELASAILLTMRVILRLAREPQLPI